MVECSDNRTAGIITYFVVALMAAAAGRGAEVINSITEQPATAVELDIEAESFSGLAVHPVFHRQAGQGFYIKEHKHASGRAFVVCDAESPNAAMVKRLDRTYDAGRYVVAVRTVLNRWQSGRAMIQGAPSGNLLRVELGLLEDGSFQTSGMMTLKTFYGSGYAFLPLVAEERESVGHSQFGTEVWKSQCDFADPVIPVRSVWNAIRITAVRIIAGGIGDVPEFSLPTVIVDQIKITNVPGYEWSEGRRPGRFDFMMAGELTAARTARQMDDGARAGAAAPEKGNGALAVRGNLLLDGSFEAGGRPYWSPALLDFSSFTFEQQDLIAGAAPHGDRFARLVPRQNGPFADEMQPPAPRSAHIRSHLFTMAGGNYKLTYQARGHTGANVTASLYRLRDWHALWSATAEFAQDWRTVTEHVTGKGEMCLVFSVSGDADTVVDLDDVRLMRDDETAAAAATMLVASPAPFGIYHDSEPLVFQRVIVNDSGKPFQTTAEWRIIDATGAEFARGEVEGQGAPGVTRAEWRMDFQGYGNFVLACQARDSEAPLLIPFARVADPASVEKGSRLASYLGVLGRNIRAENGVLLRRYGIEFKTDLQDSIIRASETAYGYRQHYTFRNEITQMQQAGLKWTPWIWNAHIAPYDFGEFGSGPAPYAGRAWMSVNEGAWYIADVLKRYQGLHDNLIMVTDEFTNQRVPRDGVAYLAEAYKAVKAVDPNIEVMNSVEVHAAECFDKLLGGVKGVWADWLGGSRYGTGKWWHARERKFVAKAGTKFWVDGVGWPGNQADLELLDRRGAPLQAGRMRQQLNQIAWDVAELVAINRPDRFSCYTTKYGSNASDPLSQFARFDGHFTPQACQWLVTAQFLREAEIGGIMILPQASNLEAVWFRMKGKNWVALLAPSPTLVKEQEIALPPEALEVRDYHLLRRAATATEKGSRLEMTQGELLFIGSGDERFFDCVRTMRVTDILEARYALLAEKDGITCAAFLRNSSGRTWGGNLTLYGNMLAGTDGEKFAFVLKPGGEKTFYKPQDPAPYASRAVTYYPVNAHLQLDQFPDAEEEETPDWLLQTKEGSGMKAGAYFWTHEAVQMSSAAAPDAAWVEEWHRSQTPAAVFIDWGANGSYKQAQVRWGGDNAALDMAPDGSMPFDYYSLHFVRYDDKALYIGAKIEDEAAYCGDHDAAQWGEAVLYRLQPALAERLGARHDGGVVTVRVVPQARGLAKADLLRGAESIPLAVDCSETDSQRSYVARIPLTLLGLDLQPGMTLGFDVVCRDSDAPDGRTEAEYVWAGATYAADDAFGFGQLILR